MSNTEIKPLKRGQSITVAALIAIGVAIGESRSELASLRRDVDRLTAAVDRSLLGHADPLDELAWPTDDGAGVAGEPSPVHSDKLAGGLLRMQPKRSFAGDSAWSGAGGVGRVGQWPDVAGDPADRRQAIGSTIRHGPRSRPNQRGPRVERF